MTRPARFMAAAAAGLCIAGAWALAQAAAKAAPTDAGKKINVVVITGGHGFDKKAFPKAFEGHADIAFEIREAKPKGKPHLFDDVGKFGYDVIALYNFNQKLTAAQRANFLKLLDRGVGLVILHHAISAYPNWDEYEKILGAKYYLQPTERNGVKYARSIWKHDVDMKVHVEDAEHPITKGMKDFVVNDETYGKWTYHGGSHVLLTTDNPLNTKQLAWVKTYRKSRVFFFQLGHGPGIFSDENYRRIVSRGIRWAAGRNPVPDKPFNKKPTVAKPE